MTYSPFFDDLSAAAAKAVALRKVFEAIFRGLTDDLEIAENIKAYWMESNSGAER